MNQSNVQNLNSNSEVQNNKELKKETIQKQKLGKLGLSNDDNSLIIKQSQPIINFQLILSYWINQNCYAIDINLQMSIIIIGDMNGYIRLFKFQQTKLKLQQVIKAHRYIVCIEVIKNSKQFISSGDLNIKIWSLLGIPIRKIQDLIGHTRPIRCLLISSKEDLIISGGYDFSIKFWIRNENTCKYDQQLLQHGNFICSLSLNQTENQLISLAWEEPKIKISHRKQHCTAWIVLQTIDVDQWGSRVCFINDHMFSFQPYNGKATLFYQFSTLQKIYISYISVDVKQSQEGCTNLFPSQFIKEKSILQKKNGENINLFLIGKNNECLLQQQIQFNHYCINGKMSSDGKYLITWDLSSRCLQIRQNLIS